MSLASCYVFESFNEFEKVIVLNGKFEVLQNLNSFQIP